jgi:hypothetical protein
VPTKDEVLGLTEQVRRLARIQTQEREAKRDAARANTRSKRILAVAVAVLTVLVVLQGIGLALTASTASTAEAATEQLLVQRSEARLNTCIKDKRFAEAHNAFVTADTASDNAFLLLLATSAGRREIAPEDQPIVDAQIAENNRVRDSNLVPVPDCSPEGITAFYEKDR